MNIDLTPAAEDWDGDDREGEDCPRNLRPGKPCLCPDCGACVEAQVYLLLK